MNTVTSFVIFLEGCAIELDPFLLMTMMCKLSASSTHTGGRYEIELELCFSEENYILLDNLVTSNPLLYLSIEIE